MKRIITSIALSVVLSLGLSAQAQEVLPPCDQALALSSDALVSLNFTVEKVGSRKTSPISRRSPPNRSKTR